MSDFSEFAVAQACAQDPQTSAADLAAIAAAQHTLWAEVAGHPHAYPALLAWLEVRGGEDVKMAIANRPTAPSAPVRAPAPAPAPASAPAESESVDVSAPTEAIGVASVEMPSIPEQYPAPYPAPIEYQQMAPAAEYTPSAPLASTTTSQSFDGTPAAARGDYSEPFQPNVVSQPASPYPNMAAPQAYLGAPTQMPPVGYGQPWGAAPAPAVAEKKKPKLALIIIASIVVISLLGAAVWIFVRRNTVPTAPVTSDQFQTLVTQTLPTWADIQPYTTTAPTKPPCSAQDNTFSHMLRLAEQNKTESQGVTLILFDTNEWALKYAGQLKACWEENGWGGTSGNIINGVVSSIVDGVTVYDMSLTLSSGAADVVHFAVYRNVYIFTNSPHSFDKKQTWATWVKTVYVPAVDEAAPA